MYDVIYADPPWQYSKGTTTPSRTIENHYPTMPLADICGMDIPSNDNCVLFLWATVPLLPDAMQVLDEWGFTYKSSMSWDKCRLGLGHWFRVSHELLLVGVKGKVSPPTAGNRANSVLRVKRTKHSRKPDEARQVIERMFPDASRLEMFAREQWPGWDTHGNQTRAVSGLRQKTLG